MKSNAVIGLVAVLFSGASFAKDDRHECEAALDRLKSAQEQDFTSSGHHEHQQAKEARAAGDYKKCADQAGKALEHLKQG